LQNTPLKIACLLATLLGVGCTPQVTPAVTSDTPRVIVVGSGAGGGTLAARLARSGIAVLLLEAGNDVSNEEVYQVPAMHARSTEDASTAWWYFVQHHTDSAIDRSDSKYTDQGILYPRGSALGGSTAVNAMVTVLPPPSDWDRLAALTGEHGFRAANMAPYYARVQQWLHVEIPEPRLASSDAQVAPILISAATTLAADGASATSPVSDAAALTTLLSQDLNQRLQQGEATGLFRLPLATRAGHRNGTLEWLHATVAEGFPLTIVTGAFVTRVLWDDSATHPTARGVEFVRGGQLYGASLEQQSAPDARETAFASDEVVLAAGAFNTPQLLMLSGVGDATELAQLGIDPIVHRAGVGQNLQDRDEVAVVSELGSPIDLVARCELGATSDPCLDDWRQGEGVYRTSGFLASMLVRSPGADRADLQIFATPGDARGYYPGYSAEALAHKNRFSWLLLKAHTHNHDGVVSLRDASPFSKPAIHFHSYDEADPLHDPDLLALVAGVRRVRQTMQSVHAVTQQEIWPGPQLSSDDDLARFIRKESWGHHACGSAKMGTVDDPDAVVDPRFRVIGADHLRVVDASVFPEIPGTFIAMPLYELAERAADVMLEDLR
jgi:choline dehydrogenase